MHIYAFGSICRGEVEPNSDVDLLAIVDGHDARFSPDLYSIYSYKRAVEIWNEGNPFAWHLHSESRLLFSADGSDFIRSLGGPAPYKNWPRDGHKFRSLFEEARASLRERTESVVFDLSTVFLALRNFASCYALGVLGKPEFSRSSALRLGDCSLRMSQEAYSVLERARLLCTRGFGQIITDAEAALSISELPLIETWMTNLSGTTPDDVP
jgi:hypothetical protein